jgi:hypothetical protein
MKKNLKHRPYKTLTVQVFFRQIKGRTTPKMTSIEEVGQEEQIFGHSFFGRESLHD